MGTVGSVEKKVLRLLGSDARNEGVNGCVGGSLAALGMTGRLGAGLADCKSALRGARALVLPRSGRWRSAWGA